MSEADDALREMARNRGCKLVKSRRRKPGGDHGRFGLKDAKTGKEMFGFGDKGLTASAEDISGFLKRGAVSGWKRSLIGAVKPAPAPAAAKRRAAKPAKELARARAAPAPAPAKRRKAEPEEPAAPTIREARPGDAGAIAGLLGELGYEVSATDARRRLQALRKAGEPVLVAAREMAVACLSWHVTPVLHRPKPVGRITMMVVAKAERGTGVGSALVEAAEARLRKAGCGLVEVTSNLKRLRAHGFYRDHGYERTSYRFVKVI